jgi:hypothetical protein
LFLKLLRDVPQGPAHLLEGRAPSICAATSSSGRDSWGMSV